MWVTHPEETVPHWPDAANIDPAAMQRLLLAAEAAVAAYAPALPPGSVQAPAAYKLATILHARDLHNAGRTDPAGNLGPDGYLIPQRPMHPTIKALLRPPGPPSFGGYHTTTSDQVATIDAGTADTGVIDGGTPDTTHTVIYDGGTP